MYRSRVYSPAVMRTPFDVVTASQEVFHEYDSPRPSETCESGEICWWKTTLPCSFVIVMLEKDTCAREVELSFTRIPSKLTTLPTFATSEKHVIRVRPAAKVLDSFCPDGHVGNPVAEPTVAETVIALLVALAAEAPVEVEANGVVVRDPVVVTSLPPLPERLDRTSTPVVTIRATTTTMTILFRVNHTRTILAVEPVVELGNPSG